MENKFSTLYIHEVCDFKTVGERKGRHSEGYVTGRGSCGHRRAPSWARTTAPSQRGAATAELAPRVCGGLHLAAQAGRTEGGSTWWVGKVASEVEGGRLWVRPLFRCPCRWRGCDSGSGQRPHWGRSCSPRGRRARRLQRAVAAARWGLGPRPEPRSLCGAQGPDGKLRGYGSSPFPNSQTPLSCLVSP